jgi:HEAT repeat protein
MTFGAAFGLLATTMELSTDDRLQFFNGAPDDLTATLQPKGAAVFLDMLSIHRLPALERIHMELDALMSHEAAVRVVATTLLTSSKTTVQAGAIIALGQIANGNDAAAVAPLLTSDDVSVREAAAVALARIGERALDELSRALSAGSPRTRALIMAGLSQTSSPALIELLEQGWRDPDARVQLTALATLEHLAPPLAPRKDELIARAKKVLAPSKSPDVALALALLK